MSKSRSRRSSARRERLTLAELMAREGVLDAKALVDVAMRCCDAIAPLHARWQWRPGLSPTSIMVTLNGSRITRVEVVTPDDAASDEHYLAPERACGLSDDARSDLYALGCILFELSAGKPPFRGPTQTDVVLSHVMAPPPRARHVPAPVGAIIERLLDKEPSDRFQSAAELRTALDSAAQALQHDSARTAA